MTIFDSSEQIEYVAVQSLHYDRYAGCQYFLERVYVDGRCGLACGEQSDEFGTHTRVLLEPVYHDIRVSKVSGSRALYNRYDVFADGDRIGRFTLVLNAWEPRR